MFGRVAFQHKAKDKFQVYNHDQGTLFLEKSIDLATQREKEVCIANLAVIDELKAYSCLSFAEKEEHRIQEAEKKVTEHSGGPSCKY